MIGKEAQCLTRKHSDKAAVEDLSFTVRPGTVTGFRSPSGPHRTGTVRPRHLTSCDAPRDEHDCLAAVAPHLSLLRDALAHGTGQDQQKHGNGGTVHGHVPPRRNSAARVALARQLTLAEWVSRTASIERLDGRAA
ncbi:hypothetical protein H0H10_14460 [Streptomyces sp. TRM S81-3]|uniref:Uncharacterized protein n=1 Tax=Streptomyces griseicoloratus TaxID=2752516 RepID=A0A926L0M9_9ACTN|nr:hypothetical protein [Streptomyces griseicoloratus]MBD0420330.1 hypothetical protein [Streptomyces griseicoloratus]